MHRYPFKVAWCYVCAQGWVEISKGKENSNLLLQCSECLTQWGNMKKLEDKECLADEVVVIKPSYEEVTMIGWEKYILID